jgi:hypothetical protein
MSGGKPRMARLEKDVKFGRALYLKGTVVEPLYELEYGDEDGEKRWFARVWLRGRPFICVTGMARSDFEFEDGKE